MKRHSRNRRRPRTPQVPTADSSGVGASAVAPAAGASGSISSETPANVEMLSVSASKSMQNQLVLRKISKNLPLDTLRTLRQVSAIWNGTFIPEIRKKSNFIKVAEYANMERVTNLMRSSAAVPFERFQIYVEAKSISSNRMQEFLSICGPLMRRVELHISGYISENDDLHGLLWQNIWTLTPELTELELRLSNLNFLESEPYMDRPSAQLPGALSKLKNLSVIRFTPSHPALSKFLNDLIRCAVAMDHITTNCNAPVLAALRDSALNLDKLRTFMISNPQPEELQILIQLATRGDKPLLLDSLILSSYQREVAESVDLLHSFFATQSSTLRSLQISFGRPSSDNQNQSRPAVRIPKMYRLQTLEFALFDGGDEADFDEGYPLQFENSKMSTCCPNLKRFLCNHDTSPADEEDETDDEDELVKHDGVTDFILHSGNLDFPDGSLIQFGKEFSSLTRLTLLLPAAGVTLGPIWTTWPALQSLTLDCHPQLDQSKLRLDSLLTGIASFTRLQREMRGILGWKTKDKKPMTLDVARQLQSKYKMAPGIADLVHLRKFVLTMNQSACSNLTDSAGYYGIALASPTLQHLEIKPVSEEAYSKADVEQPKYPGVTVSPECRDLIRHALGPLATIEIV